MTKKQLLKQITNNIIIFGIFGESVSVLWIDTFKRAIFKHNFGTNDCKIFTGTNEEMVDKFLSFTYDNIKTVSASRLINMVDQLKESLDDTPKKNCK